MSWKQKYEDIKNLHVNTLTMGSDWDGKFEDLKKFGIEIKILNRTKGISSTMLREEIKKNNNE